MGHGKETPRQKMIGMMYLVLTALLALNVSAEVLNAFIIVNESLVKTIENSKIKNEGVMSRFQAAFDENPAKTKEWFDKAKEVTQMSKNVNDTIMKYKRRIVMIGDAISEEAWDDSLLHHIQKKDDNNVPGQVMILEKNGEALKSLVENYRETLINLFGKDSTKVEAMIKNIRASLNTDDVVGNEGAKRPWEVAYFDQLPLMGVITILSKIQTDIKNVESDFLNYLYAQIDASSFKFNKLEAIVNAPTSYVLQNNKYQAEVFIAASDTTVTPKIVLNGGSELKVKDGKGIYTGSTSTVGTKSWAGVIKYKMPSGEIRDYPFKAKYEVGAPSLTVSPTKMNVFYIGVANPVEVSASGVPNEKINASLAGAGSIKRGSKGEWEVRVTKPGKVWIKASAEIDGTVKELGKKLFRVKTVPDPVAKVGSDKKNARGGVITRNALLAQIGVRAELENFDFDMRFTVTGFTVSATLSGGYEEEEKSNSYKFTAKQRALIGKVKNGKKVYVEDVMAVGPDKKPRKLGTLVFKLR